MGHFPPNFELGYSPPVELAAELDELRVLALGARLTGLRKLPYRVSVTELGIAASELIISAEAGMGEALILAQIPPAKKEAVALHAGYTMAIWERACISVGRSSPFADPEMPIRDFQPQDFARRDVRLMMAVTALIADYLQRHTHSNKLLVPHTYRDGPWIERWLSGKIAGDNVLNESRRVGYARLKEILNSNPRTPLNTYFLIRGRIDNFDIREIAVRINREASEIEFLLTPGVIKKYATHRNFEDDIVAYVQRILDDLSDEAIAAALSMTPEAVQRAFSGELRRKIASSNPNDVYGTLRRLKKNVTYGLSQGLTLYAATQLALGRPQQFKKLTGELIQSLANKPPQVSVNMWLNASARYPNDPKKRDHRIGIAYLYFQLAPRSLDQEFDNARSYHEKIGDDRYTPEVVLFGDDEKDTEKTLAGLAAKAKVSRKDLNELLLTFVQGENATLSPEQEALLAGLRKAAQQQLE